MGQYYKPINIDKLEYVYSWDFDNGLKLMEHSYIGNNFVDIVERLLSPNGAWHKCRLIWAGGYGDEGLFVPKSAKDENGNLHNIFSYVEDTPYSTSDVPEMEMDFSNHHEVREASKKNADIFKKSLPKKGNFLVNWTKKVQIDLEMEEPYETNESGNWTIHPLPLLTSNGNGKGGGDYHGNNMDLVGTWAGDEISLEYEHVPAFETLLPINFKESR